MGEKVKMASQQIVVLEGSDSYHLFVKLLKIKKKREEQNRKYLIIRLKIVHNNRMILYIVSTHEHQCNYRWQNKDRCLNNIFLGIWKLVK